MVGDHVIVYDMLLCYFCWKNAI